MRELSAQERDRALRKAEWLQRAAEHCARREFTEALECFDALTRSYPYDVEVLSEFARRAHEMGAERLACGLLSSATRLRPRDADLLASLANAFVRVRALENAEKTLLQALNASPENARAHAALIRLHACRGEFQKAQEQYRETLPADAEAGASAAREMANVPVQKLWRELSATADLEAQIGAAPEPIAASSGLLALTAPLLTAAECDRIVGAVEARRGHAATVGEGAVDAAARRGIVHWLAWPELDFQAVRKLIALVEAARRQFQIQSIDHLERVQVSGYIGEGSGHFDWHRDSEDLPEATVRKLSLALQLSPASAYEGGELELRAGDGAIKGPLAQGAAIVFRSNRVHRVTPVTAGSRWSLVCWARGPVGRLPSGIRLLN